MMPTVQEPVDFDLRGGSPSYNRWFASQDLPVHSGYYGD